MSVHKCWSCVKVDDCATFDQGHGPCNYYHQELSSLSSYVVEFPFLSGGSWAYGHRSVEVTAASEVDALLRADLGQVLSGNGQWWRVSNGYTCWVVQALSPRHALERLNCTFKVSYRYPKRRCRKILIYAKKKIPA